MPGGGSPGPRRRRRTPAEAEGEIVAAAEALLRERPFRELTVDEVMRRTGLSRPAFYVYFRDRHDLITRLVAPLRAEIDARAAEMKARDVPLRESLRTVFLEVARVYSANGGVLRALRESSGQDEDAERVWREFTQPPIARNAALIRAEMAAGRSSGLDPEATARALITMNIGCFVEQLSGREDVDPEPLVDTLVEIWVRTIQR